MASPHHELDDLIRPSVRPPSEQKSGVGLPGESKPTGE
jgi:hypothetical protein